jgi:anaerobic magnesium-protoporphyrin IX monomethyl ester cyclase
MNILFIVYDNEDYIPYFPCNIAHLTASLKDHNVIIYHQDIHHYPEEHLKKYIENNEFDYIGLGFVAGYYSFQKAIKISNTINECKNRNSFYYVLGGHAVTPDPEYFLRKLNADFIVLGEGEETLKELIKFDSFKDDLSQIKGLAYKIGKDVYINERRNPIKNIDDLPLPAYHLFPMESYRLLRYPRAKKFQFTIPIITGRGCPYKCTFCYRMDKGFRAYSNKRILEEIYLLKKKYDITYFYFQDELMMSTEERMNLFCEELINSNLDITWSCNGRLNIVTEKILKLMERSGCVFINYGIESLDDKVLNLMNKKLTKEQITKGIKLTLKSNISPGFNIIWGNIGDTKESLWDSVQFLLDYDDHSQMRTIRPVTPYPGCDLYYEAIKQDKLKDINDFYSKHKNSEFFTVNFTDLNEDEFYFELMWANRVLCRKYFKDQGKRIENQINDLYTNKDYTFRGFR